MQDDVTHTLGKYFQKRLYLTNFSFKRQVPVTSNLCYRDFDVTWGRKYLLEHH